MLTLCGGQKEWVKQAYLYIKNIYFEPLQALQWQCGMHNISIYDILMACSALENITSKTSATAGTMDIITTENTTFEEMYKF